MKKIHYTIYQITNLLNNMIYIGQHKTKNIKDSYMGSGILITQVIKKYGKQNFRKDILFDFDTYEEMNVKEAEIVNEQFVEREDTYNLTIGGGADNGYMCRNKKILNNGILQKYINLVDIPKYISEGWEFGRLPFDKPGLNKGFKWIRNIELHEQHLIDEQTANSYLQIPGWELGQLPRKHCKLPQLGEKFKNYRSITKNDIEKHVPYWEVDTYLLDGWKLGSKKSLARTLWKYQIKNMKWMHKDNLFEKQISNDEIEIYLQDGWMFGRLFHKHNKCNSLSEKQKEFMRQLWTGSKFMNDGTITKQIRKNDIELFLALGWKFGGLNNQNRIHVNNGQITHFIKKEELDLYLKMGFKRGRLSYDNKSSEFIGSTLIHNIETHKIKRLKVNEPMPAGYEEGIYIDDKIFEKLSNRTKGNRYIMNDITGEVTHIKQGDSLPEGWHYGRHKRKLTDEQKENIHRKASERTWYTNGQKNTMVPWGKEQEYIDKGWWKGRSNFHKNQRKTLAMTNGIKNIMITPEQEQEYILAGWRKGRISNHKRTNDNLSWFTNGIENVMIPPNKQQEYINNGWKRGMIQHKKC